MSGQLSDEKWNSKVVSGYGCGCWCTLSPSPYQVHAPKVPPMQTVGMTSWSSWRTRQVHHLRLRTRKVDSILDCPQFFGISVSKESHRKSETQIEEKRSYVFTVAIKSQIRPLHPAPLIAAEANAAHLSLSCSCRPCSLGCIRETDQAKQVLNWWIWA